jgi:hypothetical protein
MTRMTRLNNLMSLDAIPMGCAHMLMRMPALMRTACC